MSAISYLSNSTNCFIRFISPVSVHTRFLVKPNVTFQKQIHLLIVCVCVRCVDVHVKGLKIIMLGEKNISSKVMDQFFSSIYCTRFQ